jgi:AcrR family transcriptional regulator
VTRNEKILAAAAKLFHERGFAAVRMEDIGAKAGITGPAIYRHFKSKDAILTTLFEMNFDRFFENLGPPLEDIDVELESMVRTHLRLVLDQLEWASVAVTESRSLTPESRKRTAMRARRYTGRWVDALRRRHGTLSEAELYAVAYSILGLLNSVVHWPRPALENRAAVDLVTGLALDGLRSLDVKATTTDVARPAGEERRSQRRKSTLNAPH